MSNHEIVEDFLEQLQENDPSMVAPIQALLDIPVPLDPRITKSTAVAAIRARFSDDGGLLERFEVSKAQANLWDGERDGLREAVKEIVPGSFRSGTSGATVILTRTETAKVLYPNAAGKHQLESCLQTTILAPGLSEGPVMALCTDRSPEQLLDMLLHEMQTSKAAAVTLLNSFWLGSGQIVDNSSLYDKKGSEKSTIAIIPAA